MAKPSDRLKEQRSALPDQPGVYIYRDSRGEVLYVGKARSLRKRVNSYFTKSHDARLHALVMRIRALETIVVDTEAEALLLESNLVRRHRPPFNVKLRDDKSYPFIAVTLNDEYPRVIFTRERHRTGVRYFGPYSSAKRVRTTLDLLNRIFPYRPCEGREPGRQSGVPCLDYHIERCAAPCVGYISPQEYSQVIGQVMEVLSGRGTTIERSLREQMQRASEMLEFEQAARLRNRITALKQVLEVQAVERAGRGSFDVLGVALGENTANVQVLQVRDDRLVDRAAHYVEQTEGLAPSTVLTQFMLSYYEPGRAVPSQIVVATDLLAAEDISLLEDELARVREARVEVRSAQRGEKRRLAELAQRNASFALQHDTLAEQTRRARRAAALEELRDTLDLEQLPLRIECYDISNLQEHEPVASMVVLEDGQPAKQHYRKFAMRHEHGQNDFAMMAEVIRRRFTRLAQAQAADLAHGGDGDTHGAVSDGQTHEPDESFDSTPDLVVIDGGKGQLSAAADTLRELGIERVAICSLAKREEEVYVPGHPNPVEIARDSFAGQLLQRIRNEAHRFALGYHRTRRAQHTTTSVLDSLENVGPARKRALLNFFGSPERVLAATRDELEAVPGLPGKVARRIYEQLHRLGSGAPPQ